MKRILVLLALFVLVPATAVARPETTSDARLDAVASTFAMRRVGMKCYRQEEPDSPWGYGAWGYVIKPLGKQKFGHLDVDVCEGALRINDETLPGWQRAIGSLVLIHESYHLRRWSGAASEAKTECKAIRHWKVGARMLGATEETVEDLWGEALASHYRLAEYTDWMDGSRPYYDPTCEVPPLIPPEALEG